MIKEWSVLTVDDDPEKQEGIERVLAARMDENTFIFTAVNSFDEGITLIKNNRFDLVILDVHEDAGDPAPDANTECEDQRGEQLLQIIKSERFIPVVFYTGFPQKVVHLASPFVKVVGKGSPLTELREAVRFILSTGLPELLRHIEEQSRSYMWDSLNKVFEGKDISFPPADISLLMARNLAGNLSQKIVKGIIGLDTNKINPLEMYQYPPDFNECNPADIYKKSDNSWWMVMTTACDFEQCKADNVLMAKITPLKEHHLYSEWERQRGIFDNLSEEVKREKVAKKPVNVAMDEVRRLVKGRNGERYKFLPGTFFIADCVVDFQDLIVVPIGDVEGYELICHLDNPYREEMLFLFSKYYGRIGTPDYDDEFIWSRIDSEFQGAGQIG